MHHDSHRSGQRFFGIFFRPVRRTLCIIICIFSAVISNIGLDEIIAVASPVLDVVYPPALVLICLAFFSRYIKNDWIFRIAALGALIFSFLAALDQYGGISVPFYHTLPLSSLGFGWVLPAAAGGLLGALPAFVRKHRNG